MPRWSGAQDLQEGRGPLDIARRVWIALTRRFDVAWSFSHKLDCSIPARMAKRLHGAAFIYDWCDRWGGAEGLFDLCMNEEGFRRLPLKVQAARQRAFAREAVLEESVCRNDADGVTVICSALRERALELGVPAERLLLIPSGASLDAVRPLDKLECRHKLRLPEDAVLLGYVAGFNPDEDLLLGALEAALARAPQMQFVCAGAPLKESDEGLRRRGIRSRVHYLGWLPLAQCAELYGACDMLLLPLSARRLNAERFPHKITDYLSAGRPIAACDAGDVRPLIGSADVAEIGAPSAEGLAQAIERLHARRGEWDAMGLRSRRLAEEKLNWNSLGDRALEFIEAIAKRKKQ